VILLSANKPNRLINEKSPYLLQHAYNPVDWYPWGEEAFAEARRRDVPIFLSIGYSTCHWCHVMERESFEDEEVAAALNDTFVCIKVDREERPDLDAFYMSVCQALTGSGGWPLNVILTPERQPFYAGTYFPRHSRYGRPGLLDLAAAMQSAWREKRSELLEVSQSIIAHMRAAQAQSPGAAALNEATLERAYRTFQQTFDTTCGGFGQAPKFPTPHNLTFLLRYWKRTGEPEALQMVEKTLQAMGSGGIYDHIGFGFHRYSTDRKWLLPHFEKMLYDQALLAIAYLEAYQATHNEEYARIAQEIFTYVLRDMTSPEGGFYSAEDADSEGEEGKFYVWTLEELREILCSEELNLLQAVSRVSAEGNWREEATRQPTGSNILHLARPLAEYAAEAGLSDAALAERWEAMRQKLFAVRKDRVHPHKDDKVLTDWNGLMIAALALGGRVLADEKWVAAAEKGAAFVLRNLRQEDGRLLKRYRAGEAALPAHIDDYAFFVWGLIELYETTFAPHYLRTALQLNQLLIEHHWDHTQGGFFFTADDADELPVRQKEIYDGATPAGNSVAVLNCLRLSRLTGREELAEIAEQALQAFAASVARHPAGHTHLLQAVDFLLGPSHEIVIAGDPEAEDTQVMLRALNQTYVPNKVVILRPAGGGKQAEIEELAPYITGQEPLDGKATAYVCSGFACQRPTHSVEQMLQQLGQ
jgi:uncharacterized protein YyaL (SSP411 family)